MLKKKKKCKEIINKLLKKLKLKIKKNNNKIPFPSTTINASIIVIRTHHNNKKYKIFISGTVPKDFPFLDPKLQFFKLKPKINLTPMFIIFNLNCSTSYFYPQNVIWVITLQHPLFLSPMPISEHPFPQFSNFEPLF